MAGISVKPLNGAAYAASQPLFDALATAVQLALSQKVNLIRSRNIVQQLHVNLVDTTKIDDVNQHKLYIDSAVKAWRAALEAYTEVFQQLTAVTAADKSQGKEASKGHANFRAMAETARLAHRASKEYKLQGEAQEEVQENSTGTSSDASDEDDSFEESNESAAINDNGKRSSVLHESAATQLKASKIPKLNATQDVDKLQTALHNVDPSERKTTKSEKARQRRDRKLAKRKGARALKENTDPAATLGTTAGSDSNNVAHSQAVEGVEYDDVTAEVDRRLEAKKEKRKAEKESKKEKKRKRESGASVPGATEVEKRVKKKSKATDEVPILAQSDETSSKRALNAEENGGLNEDGKGRKKRRKADT